MYKNSFHITLIILFCFSGLFGSDITTEAQKLETELLPFFSNKAQKNNSLFKTRTIKPPNQAQLFRISALWKQLSTQFKTAYLQSLEIPTNSHVYVSPGFGVEIYYSTTGIDAVNTEDKWGALQDLWQQRLSVPNGVPDYVDEVAWAIDSAWGMEIVKFGFKTPYPFVSEHYKSSNYKVRIEEMGDYYGLTYCAGLFDPTEIGFRSLLTIRNNWNGWDINSTIDYESNPQKGIGVTCAHEFFHGIQFAMSHQVQDDIYLDKFPLSWIEATAVTMEELAFGYVNDYTQYLDAFFKEPSQFSFFSSSDSYDWYANSIAALFLFHNLKSSPDIDFIQDIFISNFKSPSSIDTLLSSCALDHGTSWINILNRFHSESFFTGTRENSRYFLPDSKLLPEWEYFKGECKENVSLEKNILPYGMQIFSFVPENISTDFKVQISCTIEDSEIDESSAIRVILTGDENDTIIIGSFVKNAAHLEMSLNHSCKEIVVVVSNGDYNNSITAEVLFKVDYKASMAAPKKNIKFTKIDHVRYQLNGVKVSTKLSFTNNLSSGIYITRDKSLTPRIKLR